MATGVLLSTRSLWNSVLGSAVPVLERYSKPACIQRKGARMARDFLTVSPGWWPQELRVTGSRRDFQHEVPELSTT